MRRVYLGVAASLCLTWYIPTAGASAASDIFQFIDPLIGTANGGHVFAGATLPFGMAKAVADVNGENQGGFAYDFSNITGFSHAHDDGTGGAPSLGFFPIFPQSGCPDDDLNQCKWATNDRAIPWVNGSVLASPGYFSINLTSGTRAEMTVSNHSALYRFTFPENSQHALNPVILQDLIDLPFSRVNGSILVDNKTGRMIGNGTFGPSFGIGTYDAHFCSDFQGAQVRDTGLFKNNRAGQEPKSQRVVEDNVNNNPQILPAGAWVRFQKPELDNQLLVRVGISFISTDQACTNAERELATFDFEETKKTAEDAWSKKLSVVSLDAGPVSKDLQTTFWSGLYRTFISPQDYTGENPLWKSDEPYYDSYYCIWDSFRSIHPLITLVDPESQSRMVRSLIDIYVHEGWLPDCRMSLCKGLTQGGSNADIVLVDSYLKNIQNIDWNLAYAAIIQDAENEPENWAVQGRGGLHSWKNLGYIPADDYDPYGVGGFTRSISRTVEYAYDDFCIAQLATSLNHQADAEKYFARSKNWINVFDAQSPSSINGTDTGFTGFLQPRYLNGTFGYQDPIFCSPLLNFTSCYLNPSGHETYEGSSWLYTFFAPGDMAANILTLGGPSTFVKRLDYLHESGLLYIGDEQAFLTVFLYHYAGRPALSAKRIHEYIPRDFNTSVAGIPGNDDSGAMGSFSTLSMMGIFPNPGQDVYFITPPFFPSVSVTSPQTGKTATIRNVNFDASYKSIYIQSATLNGQPYTKNWITHSFFLNGGVLELTLGLNESQWGTKKEDLPPSLSTGGFKGYVQADLEGL